MRSDSPISGRRLLIVVIGVIALGVFSRGIAYLALRLFSRISQTPASTTLFSTGAPEPNLDVDPMARLRALRKKEEDALNHYAWVNRSSGTVQIPVDRAMDLLAERGFPVHPK